MVYWETAHTIPGQPQFVLDWARQWQAAEKIVYSRTLAEPHSARTRIEREFDPDAVGCPAVVGGGKRFFPDGVRLDLLEERRFGSGVLVLRYGVRTAVRGVASGVESSEILRS